MEVCVNSVFSRFENDHKDIFEMYPGLSDTMRISFEVIYDALDQFGDGLVISWNGGKDATVLFHLIRLVCQWRDPSYPFSSLLAVNFRAENTFKEVDEFSKRIAEKYSVEYHDLPIVDSLKNSLRDFVEKNPSKKAFFMGSRRTDPYCDNLTSFTPCDTNTGWPDIIRVNPILDWGYHQVWEFLRGFEIEYCTLYDQGFTSLGSPDKTIPNPELQKDDGSYFPAHKLQDVSTERA
eukprot:CAMPEP_0206157768 /NCGR_PEP_ID=MMETSP1474-20131121/4207_1 /ASSEMBLY_ACC=CAM_ASM_001110 /TAXON_ID=97495 /ORGANISM="Imantonia sp., Strain RCC918" /LENGTH=234 /DNA_ID=CAMNT_0053557503 /DNA_START=28 /DNA_END=729 /DNA_ORIENTATION=-